MAHKKQIQSTDDIRRRHTTSEIMACTQGLFSDSSRAAARELSRKQAEACKLLFTIHTVEEIGIQLNNPTCRFWHRAHIYYASLEQRAYLDLNIWYDAPTHSQLEFAQWMGLQALLNRGRRSCMKESMTYRTSFHVAFGSQSDMNSDKREKNELLENRYRTQLCPLSVLNQLSPWRGILARISE